MKRTSKILKLKGKKLETVEEVRAALIAIIQDIESGDVTVTEAEPIRDQTKMIMRKLCAQIPSPRRDVDNQEPLHGSRRRSKNCGKRTQETVHGEPRRDSMSGQAPSSD
jgi:hypothetical protein